MSGPRFSIANLLAAVAIVAIGLAALNATSLYVPTALIIATASLLLLAILATIYRTGESRAFWLGVAVFGWFYFIAMFTSVAPPVTEAMERPLRAFRAAFWTVSIPDSERDKHSTRDMDTAYDGRTGTTLAWPEWRRAFGPTINCLVNWLVALAGGIAGRWFYVTAERNCDQPPQP